MDIGTVNVECDWEYRGMSARYDGHHRFAMTVSSGESHDEVVDRAYDRARREVARRMAFGSGIGIHIQNLRIDGGRFSRN